MARKSQGRVPPGGKEPFCADCGSKECHVVVQAHGGVDWLCGSCEFLRAHPEAQRATVKPGLPSSWPKGRSKPQAEKLFDDDEVTDGG